MQNKFSNRYLQELRYLRNLVEAEDCTSQVIAIFANKSTTAAGMSAKEILKVFKKYENSQSTYDEFVDEKYIVSSKIFYPIKTK